MSYSERLSPFSKFRIRWILNSIKRKFNSFDCREFTFSPTLLYLDLFEPTKEYPVSKQVLNSIIIQIENHFRLNDTVIPFMINIVQGKLLDYSPEQQPIKLDDDTLYIKIFHLYNKNNPKYSLLNIDESEFVALLCREFTKYYLKINKIQNVSARFEEMAMCFFGVCKEAHLHTNISTMYFDNKEVKYHYWFVSSGKELQYAYNYCKRKFYH